MRESALLVASSDADAPTIRACLRAFDLDLLVVDARAVLPWWRPVLFPLILCEVPLPSGADGVVRSALSRGNPVTPVVFLGGTSGDADPGDVPPVKLKECLPGRLNRVGLSQAITRALLRRRIAVQLRANGGVGACDEAILKEAAEHVTGRLEASEKLARGHSGSVAGLAARLAAHHGLSPTEIESARLAGVLHDVGKVQLPNEILCKPGALSSSEWLTVRRHPEAGAQILLGVEAFAPVAVYVRHHHERYDGRGYPRGLHDGQIPLVSKIVAVADAYHAMVTPRAYRATSGVRYAAAELHRHAGRQWDPEIVGGLFSCCPELAAGG
jgi:HD domain